jgi:hypothetical protein
MANQRTVLKSLAAKEDLLWGRGQVNQSRAGGTYPVNKLSFTQVVTSEAALALLDPAEFPSAAVVENSTYTVYEYSALNGYEAVRIGNARSKRGAAFSLTAEALTPIITVDVPTRVEGTTALDAASQQFGHASGRLIYEGSADLFKVDVNLVVRESNLDELHFFIARNGGVIATTKQVLPAVTAGARSLSFSVYLELEASQILEVFVANNDTTDDLTVAQFNMAVSGQ